MLSPDGGTQTSSGRLRSLVSDELQRVPAQARPEEDAGAVLGRRRASARRSSSSSATTRGASTTTSGSSATARSRRWAVPKGVPLEPGERALAVHVEDHPLDYAGFEGEIPEGEYGAGTVEIWDRGTYELVEEKRDGGLTVRLHGERLEGTWTLVPGARSTAKEKNWLLLRKRDDDAPARAAERLPADARDARGAAAAAATSWLYEVKWDGYRALGYVRGGEAKLVSRNGNDLTGRFPDVARALAQAVRSPDCVVDGEVCALDEHGPPELLGDAAGQAGHAARLRGLRRARDRRRAGPRPAADRAAASGSSSCSTCAGRRCSSRRHSTTARRSSRRRREQGLEGVMAKRAGSPLPGGQAHARLAEDQDARPAGVRDLRLHEGRRAGARDASARSCSARTASGELAWVGNCGTGFTERDIDELLAKLEPLAPRDVAVPRRAEDAEGAQGRRRLGRAEARRARSSSPSGRTTGTCARRRSRGCATTSRAARCGARIRRGRTGAA